MILLFLTNNAPNVKYVQKIRSSVSFNFSDSQWRAEMSLVGPRHYLKIKGTG
jgi:hypothetical protein